MNPLTPAQVDSWADVFIRRGAVGVAVMFGFVIAFLWWKNDGLKDKLFAVVELERDKHKAEMNVLRAQIDGLNERIIPLAVGLSELLKRIAVKEEELNGELTERRRAERRKAKSRENETVTELVRPAPDGIKRNT